MRIVTLAAVAVVLSTGFAFAGDRNYNHNEANASAGASVNSSVSNSIKNRVQAGTPGSFGGGGPCPEYFGIGVPGGSIALGGTCREGKQAIKAGTVSDYFGKRSARDYLCDSDDSFYGLDHCVNRRIKKSGVVQARDRARVRN